MNQEGSLGAAALGSTAGVIASVGVALLTRNPAGIVSGLVLCPVGAAVSYNLMRPSKRDDGLLLYGRLDLPSLTTRCERQSDGSSSTVYDARLVTVRF